MKPKFVLIILLIFVAFRTYGQTKADDIIETWVTGGKEPAKIQIYKSGDILQQKDAAMKPVK